LAYPSGSPVEKPSLQLPLIEHPQKGMLCFQRPTSFIFQSPWYMSPLPGSPAGPLWREMPVSRAFLYITFRVPSKGAPLPGFPHRAPTERNAPFPEASVLCLSKSLVNEPTPGCPTGPLQKEMSLQSLPLYILQGPQ